MKRWETIWRETKEHAPESFAVSVFVGILVLVIFYFWSDFFKMAGSIFEIAHPLHVFVSAVATSAIYYKYKKSVLSATLVGVVGAILIGTISDVLLPYVAGNLFSLETILHIPIIENPLNILLASFVGSLVGIYYGGFKIAHFSHVFLSVLASLFYLLAFSIPLSAPAIFAISLVVFLIVYVPCCMSDIVFPILFIKRPCNNCGHWHG